MSFELTDRVVKIRLRGTEFDEVEARATIPLAGLYVAILGSDIKLLPAFGDHLLDWNIELGGEPVPANGEGVEMLHADLALSLAANWLNGSNTVVRDSPLADLVMEDLNGAGSTETEIAAL